MAFLVEIFRLVSNFISQPISKISTYVNYVKKRLVSYKTREKILRFDSPYITDKDLWTYQSVNEVGGVKLNHEVFGIFPAPAFNCIWITDETTSVSHDGKRQEFGYLELSSRWKCFSMLF